MTPLFTTLFWCPGSLVISSSSVASQRKRFIWPDEKQAVDAWLFTQKLKRIRLFVESPHDNWHFEIPPSGITKKDWIYRSYRQRKKISQTHLLWASQGVSFSPQILHMWGLENQPEIQELLEFLFLRKKHIHFYSTGLTRIRAAEAKARAQGFPFKPYTFSLLIHLSPSHTRHFVFWGNTFIFIRELAQRHPDHLSQTHASFLSAGEETITYLQKQYPRFSGPSSVTIWDRRSKAEESCFDEKPLVQPCRIHLNTSLLYRTSPQLRQQYALKRLKILSGIELFFLLVCGAHTYLLKSSITHHEKHLQLLTTQYEESFHKRQAFPFSPATVKDFLHKQAQAFAPPLLWISKLEKCLPPDLLLSRVSWDQRLLGQHRYTLDLPKPSSSQTDSFFQGRLQSLLENLQQTFEPAKVQCDETSSPLYTRLTLLGSSPCRTPSF